MLSSLSPLSPQAGRVIKLHQDARINTEHSQRHMEYCVITAYVTITNQPTTIGVILTGQTRLRLSVYRLTSFDVPAVHGDGPL